MRVWPVHGSLFVIPVILTSPRIALFLAPLNNCLVTKKLPCNKHDKILLWQYSSVILVLWRHQHFQLISAGIADPVHACVGETATLECASPFTMTVLRGEYGQHSSACETGCCQPNAADCTQVMADTNSQEWQSVKVRYSLKGIFVNWF